MAVRAGVKEVIRLSGCCQSAIWDQCATSRALLGLQTSKIRRLATDPRDSSDWAVLGSLLNDPMIVDRAWPETMKVAICDDGIVRMNKQLTKKKFSATNSAITVMRRHIVDGSLESLDGLVREGHNRGFFNAAGQQLVNEGVPVEYSLTRGHPCAEIDDSRDFVFARSHVSPKLVSVDPA